jgi:hypothetical protein
VRQERIEPYKRNVSCFTSESYKSNERGQSDCDGSHHANSNSGCTECLCTSANANNTGCICTGSASAKYTGSETRDETGKLVEPNEFGNIKCPETGRVCHIDECDQFCKGDTKE